MVIDADSTSTDNENLSYSLYEPNTENRNITYKDLLREVNLLEMTSDFHMDTIIAEEVNYSTNFNRKELDRIADYYEISKRKKKKDELIQEIVIFEHDPENLELVYRRKKLWSYMQEIKDDKYLRKFLIFN